MLETLDKSALLQSVRTRLGDALAQVSAAQRAAQEGATHEENRAEGDKDMRATEVSYVARGQAERVVALRDELARCEAVVPRRFGEDAPIALGALVLVEGDEGREQLLLLLPGGAGLVLEVEGLTVSVVGSSSPLGRALLGQRAGDTVSFDVGGAERSWTVLELV
jgi:transcription elongation GreA/GreB family factor